MKSDKDEEKSIKHRAILPLKKWQQEFFFGNKVFSHAEQIIIIEILSASKPFTERKSSYNMEKFYTPINKLIEKGVVKAFPDPEDKRKRRYAIIPTKENIEIASLILGGLLGNYKELNDPYFSKFIDRFIERYGREELIKGFLEISKKLEDELKYGYSLLDEAEYHVDKAIPDES